MFSFIASRLLRIIGVPALALALASCSAVKLGYNNLPELGYWWLDAHADFDDAQSLRVRQALASVHQWHRSRELPRLGQLLQSLEQQAQADATPARICALAGEARERAQAVLAQLEAPVASLGASLAPAQVDHVARHFARGNEKWREDWLAPPVAERRDKRIKQLEGRFESVYGRLEEAQRALVRRHVEASAFDPRRVLAERERRQADLLQVLRAVQAPGLPPEEGRRLVRGALDRSLASPDPALRAHQELLLQETCTLVAAVHNAAPPAQRQGAAQRLRAWQRDVADLAAPR